MSSELANKEHAGAMAAPVQVGKSISSGGRPQQSQQSVSRIVMYQGTQEEEMMYGDTFKRGEFLDELVKESLGRTIRFVVIGNQYTFFKYQKGIKAPVYFYSSWDEVPEHIRPEFTWSGPDGNTPPAGTECANVIILRVLDDQSVDPMPYLFQFKRTSLPAWNGKQGIERHENRLVACLYELSSVDGSNAEGKPYKKITARMVHRLKPESELYQTLMQYRAQLADLKQQASSIGHDDDLPV
jgi:hypothetical protein